MKLCQSKLSVGWWWFEKVNRYLMVLSRSDIGIHETFFGRDQFYVIYLIYVSSELTCFHQWSFAGAWRSPSHLIQVLESNFRFVSKTEMVSLTLCLARWNRPKVKSVLPKDVQSATHPKDISSKEVLNGEFFCSHLSVSSKWCHSQQLKLTWIHILFFLLQTWTSPNWTCHPLVSLFLSITNYNWTKLTFLIEQINHHKNLPDQFLNTL